MTKFFALCLCAFLTACATPVSLPNTAPLTESPVSGKDLELPKPKVEIDAYLLEPCEKLPKFDVKRPTEKDVLRQKAAEALIYKKCALRHKSLSELVKKAFNIE